MTDFPLGFRAGATAAGLKPSGRDDLGLIVSDRPCVAAALFTRNKFPGENIKVCRDHLSRGAIRALVVHAGQANACTGSAGEKAARDTAQAAAEVAGCGETEVLVGSTGVIGTVPKVDRIRAGLAALGDAELTSEGILHVGRAMMTTDTVSKTATAKVRIGGKTIRILGIAKGSGMIHPNLGTMLVYVMTDAAVAKPALKKALSTAADETFNCLTVDGDTSTSDMVVVMANGAAGNASLKVSDPEFAKFQKKITAVCSELARSVAADGEGATKLVSVRARKATNVKDARKVAMAVASSNLLKCAIFGHDPNWGRIACAVGYSGGRFEPAKVVIKLGKAVVFRKGQPAPHDRPAIAEYLKTSDEILIDVELGAGTAEATAWTCDLTYDYVKINAEYTT
ncbi:bifunctional glutamate N-acetyltransferase/amino-acid acetyltransferase ArgJ [bacterium]|nr:bifunctional glutamate N-acetyltransferase/amino-acid acetyltransferase ArgJ [bacterium]